MDSPNNLGPGLVPGDLVTLKELTNPEEGPMIYLGNGKRCVVTTLPVYDKRDCGYSHYSWHTYRIVRFRGEGDPDG